MTHGCYSAALLLQNGLMAEMHFKILELSHYVCAALLNANDCIQVSEPHWRQWCEAHFWDH